MLGKWNLPDQQVVGLTGPIEWSSCNLSLGTVSAPAGAGPAELAWVAQPATRPSSTQTPPVPGPDNQAKHAGEPRCNGVSSFR